MAFIEEFAMRMMKLQKCWHVNVGNCQQNFGAIKYFIIKNSVQFVYVLKNHSKYFECVWIFDGF